MVHPGVVGNLIKLNNLFASFWVLNFKVLEYSEVDPIASRLCEVECKVHFTF